MLMRFGMGINVSASKELLFSSQRGGISYASVSDEVLCGLRGMGLRRGRRFRQFLIGRSSAMFLSG